MKTRNFFRFLFLMIASGVLISCSKEKFTPVNSNETSNIPVSKAYPVTYYGGVSGTLIPAPYYAAIKFYHEDGNFTAYCFADQDGHFKIGTLIPGVYNIMIIYNPNTRPEPQEYKYYEIRDVKVLYDVVTELGEIFLISK